MAVTVRSSKTRDIPLCVELSRGAGKSAVPSVVLPKSVDDVQSWFLSSI
jgi:hypothetical protein